MNQKKLQKLRTNHLKRIRWDEKLAIKLGVLKLWYEYKPETERYPYRCEKYNLWNPLTWLMIIGSWAYSLIWIAFYEYWRQLPTQLKTKKIG